MTNRMTRPEVARALAVLSLAALALTAGARVAVAQTATPTPPWVASGANISNTNPGNVGIGRTGPADKLHINGNVTNGGGITIDNSGAARFRLGSLGTTVPNWGGQFINAKYNEGAGNWTLDDPTLNAAFLKLDVRNLLFGNEVGIYRMASGSNPRPDSGWFPVAQFKLDTGNVYLAPSVGNVGVGTTSPASKFHVHGAGTWSGVRVTTAASGATAEDGVNFGYDDREGAYVWNREASPAVIATSNVERVRVDAAGNVGIGTSAPATKLHVNGDVTVTGNISAKYQDVAEWVEAGGRLAAGTVVVLDTRASDRVTSSSSAYDTRVAGVVSEQPGLLLGEAGEGKVKVATTGRVRVRVDATKGAIRIGDLLVTSGVPGVAMKSEPVLIGGRPFHTPGTIIGKALEPLAGGVGEIKVLLSLQ